MLLYNLWFLGNASYYRRHFFLNFFLLFLFFLFDLYFFLLVLLRTLFFCVFWGWVGFAWMLTGEKQRRSMPIHIWAITNQSWNCALQSNFNSIGRRPEITATSYEELLDSSSDFWDCSNASVWETLPSLDSNPTNIENVSCLLSWRLETNLDFTLFWMDLIAWTRNDQVQSSLFSKLSIKPCIAGTYIATWLIWNPVNQSMRFIWVDVIEYGRYIELWNDYVDEEEDDGDDDDRFAWIWWSQLTVTTWLKRLKYKFFEINLKC